MPDKNNLFLLDIDNVLNTDDHLGAIQDEVGYENREEFLDYFHDNQEEYLQPDRVKRLDDCLDELDPEPFIVLCSSWQTMGVETVQETLKEHGFGHPIQDRTFDIYRGSNPGVRFMVLLGTVREIEPDRLVILDDDGPHDSFDPHHISPEDGLTEHHVESIKEVWTVDYVPNDSPPAKVPKSMRDDNKEESDNSTDDDQGITIGGQTIRPDAEPDEDEEADEG